MKAPKLISQITKIYGLKNDTATAKALGIAEGTANNLNSGRAGKGLQNAYKLVIAVSKELPEKKRKKILSNMSYLLDS